MLWLALVPAGLGAFMLYLAVSQGDALASLHATQSNWHRSFHFLRGITLGAQRAWDGLDQIVSHPPGTTVGVASSNEFIQITDFAFLLYAIVALVGVFRRLPLAYGIYSLAALGVAVSAPVAFEPLASLPRYVSDIFPLQIWLAVWAHDRRRLADRRRRERPGAGLLREPVRHLAMGRLSSARPALALLAAYALLAVAWAMTNAPFSAPDEAEHYIRAVGVSDGGLVGRPAIDPNPALTPKQRAWTNQAARAVHLPSGLSPAGLDCVVSRARISAACQNGLASPPAQVGVTSVGTYQPLPYLLPALVLRAADHAPAAGRLARLAGLIPWLLLLAGAVAAVWDRRRGPWSLTGLLLGITPMVIFVGASLTGSGLEIMGSLAFMAALLRLGRPVAGPSADHGPGHPPRAPRWVWVLAGGAGALLALSRTLGPAWVAVDLALAGAFLGRHRALEALRSRPRAAATAGAAVLTAIVLNRLWEAAHGPHVTTSLLPSPSSLRGGLNQLTDSLPELVGRFGYLEVHLPVWILIAWGLAGALALAGALRAGTRRERLTLAAAAIGCLAAPAYLFAAVTTHTGFGLQGRHYLALVVVLALLAGEVLGARATRLEARWPAVLGLLVAVGQLTAWWVNSRRYAVGSAGSWWFLGSARWSPPLGWEPWVAVVLVACVLLACSGLDPRRRVDSAPTG